MKTFRASIHGAEHDALRTWLISKRQLAGLTQRELADKLGVVRSLVGKVETGERRLDVIEFASYCEALGAAPAEFYALSINP